ncbi:MAG: hypothetical protein WBI09_07450 [Methanothrix sp.]|nr:hypothetical protein [Euryarchaeota archaeon]
MPLQAFPDHSFADHSFADHSFSDHPLPIIPGRDELPGMLCGPACSTSIEPPLPSPYTAST